jgi:FkbM family methyltransferase
LIPKDTIVKVRSGLNKDLKWIVGSSVHGCWLGTYELEKQAALVKIIRAGMTVFDIGANAGFYTLAFSSLVGDKGHVWAFEPYAENAFNILRHIKLNNLRNVTFLQAAVVKQTGVTGFHIARNNSTGNVTREGMYRVPSVSIDDLIAYHSVPIPQVIKIDVEGAESLVLNGARTLLSKQHTRWFVALHGDQEKQNCLEILESHGYRIYQLDGTPFRDGQIINGEIYAEPVQKNRIG